MTYKKHTKWISGPAGINCPCCRKGNKKMAKTGDRRRRRRVARQALKSEE